MSERNYPGDKDDVEVPVFEASPLSRSEYITTLVHFYRGEVFRSTHWRIRLDNTTNWAILSVMGLVTFSLGEPSHSHVGILAGMVLVFTFLGIEARRFRFFDVWRSRVRIVEENFFGPILRRDLRSPVEKWGMLVAEDLLHPRFRITFHQALRARLIRNYGALFALLLASWLVKLLINPGLPGGLEAPFLKRMALGPIPWWVAAVFVTGIYLYLVGILALVPTISSPEQAYWGREGDERASHVDI